MRHKVARFIHRYVVAWYVVTIFLYAAMIPMTVIVFPATTLLLSIIVLFGGFTSSVAALAGVLTDAEEAEAEKGVSE